MGIGHSDRQGSQDQKDSRTEVKNRAHGDPLSSGALNCTTNITESIKNVLFSNIKIKEVFYLKKSRLRSIYERQKKWKYVWYFAANDENFHLLFLPISAGC